MGASAGGVSVKTDTTNYKLSEIVKDLFGSDFIQTDNFEDTRNTDKYYLVKTANVITIYNSQFVENFYKRQDTKDVKYFIDYFQNPELIFAHERYDSGGTYSYALIYNGELKRQFRSLSYETSIDFGDLEEIEKDWENGEITKSDLGGGEFEISIKNLKTGFECDEGNLSQVILDQLQFDKLNFDGDDSKIFEKAFFIREPKLIDTDDKKNNVLPKTEPAKTEAWWKFWK